MRQALALAARAAESGEVPVGAVVVVDGVVVGEGWNQPIAVERPDGPRRDRGDARGRAAPAQLPADAAPSLVVTVEPCLMCVGAMIHARIATVVYGTPEPRAGALGSAIAAHETPGLNHRLAVVGGVLADECRALMQTFFRDRRG